MSPVTRSRILLLARATAAFVLLGFQTYAADFAPKVAAEKTPQELEGIGITEHLGEKLDLNLPFVDENGHPVALGRYFGSKPVFLSLVYYGCPNLCGFYLNGVLETLQEMEQSPSRDFEFVAVSIDPSEGPGLARQKKSKILKEYGRSRTETGWHFLTGTEANIKRLAQQVGFGYRWEKSTGQWAHAAAGIFVSPDGNVSRYLYGVRFEPKTFKLGLLEAAQGRVGSLVDKILLFCYKFDPTKGRYSLHAYNVMRAGAGVTFLIVAIFMIPFWLRQTQRSRHQRER